MTTFLGDAIHAHLLEHGPSTAVEIHHSLITRGLTAAKTPSGVRSSLGSSRFAFQLPDERWDLTTRALTGVMLTVRPRSRLRDNVLWAHGDLEPFDGLLTGDTIPLVSGGLVRTGGGQIRIFVGPAGWLPDVAEGGLLGLRWTGEALDVFTVDQPVANDDASLAPIRALLRQHRDGLAKPYGAEPALSTVLLSALREAPLLLSRPHPPLSEILPLPPHVYDDTSLWEAPRHGRRLTLHLPERVLAELQRRAALLGEDLADHAAVLLGAASDRLQVDLRDRHYPYTGGYGSYGDYSADEPANDDVGPARSLRSVP